MSRLQNLAGMRFGRLMVIQQAGHQCGHVLWHCHCDCGKTSKVTTQNLKNNKTRSCGCLSSETTGNRARTHGMNGTPTHTSWKSMLERCLNPNNTNYADYGAKGICVCQDWQNGFSNFYKDMGLRPKGKTLDRIDPLGNYEPGNCQWSTPRQQRMNQTRGTITLAQADGIRRLRKFHGWGPNTIAHFMKLSKGAVNGVLYLGNLAHE